MKAWCKVLAGTFIFLPAVQSYAVNVGGSDFNANPVHVSVQVPNEMIDWGTPKALLPGANDYVLQGNPSEPGVYTVRLKLPPNYKIPPYTQTTITYITVLSGDYHIGEGNIFDANKGRELPPGSFITVPANTPVYAWTTTETIIQIHGLGPWGVKYLGRNKESA